MVENLLKVIIMTLFFCGLSCKQKNIISNERDIPKPIIQKKEKKNDLKEQSSNVNKNAKIDSLSMSQLESFVDGELPSVFDYYKNEKIEDYSVWSSKMFGRCCSNTDLTFTENLFLKIYANFSNKKYPIDNIFDTEYLTSFVFKKSSNVKISLQLDKENSFLDGKNSNKNLLKSTDTIMSPIKLSLINGYVKSKTLFYENGRVEELDVFVNNKFKEKIILLDTPKIQEFQINSVFTTNDTLTLVPQTYYSGTKYDDICISEIQTNLGYTALKSLNKKFNLVELMNNQ